MSSAEEIERLAKPDAIPSLWRYLYEKHPWMCVIVPVSTAVWIVSLGWRMSWT